jgi:ATP-dependent Clp protease ATP-binding subunit ClpC
MEQPHVASGEVLFMTSYSNHARRALTHANLLVQRYRHPFVDTGHLLVGVMLTEGSIGWQVMQAMDLHAAQAEPHLQAMYPIVDMPGDTPNADALNMTLELAASEAAWLSHHYIGTEHLLLGLTRSNAGNASALLRRLGTTPEHLRSRLRRVLSEGASEVDWQTARQIVRLSELSRRIINAADQLALSLGHSGIGLGHLLLVMVQETRSPTSPMLRACGLDEARLREGLAQGDALLLASIDPILSQLRDLVEQVGSHYTGTEHLLLALIHDPAGRAALHTYGVQMDSLERHLQAK